MSGFESVSKVSEVGMEIGGGIRGWAVAYNISGNMFFFSGLRIFIRRFPGPLFPGSASIIIIVLFFSKFPFLICSIFLIFANGRKALVKK